MRSKDFIHGLEARFGDFRLIGAARLPEHLAQAVDQHEVNMIFIPEGQEEAKNGFIDIQGDGGFVGDCYSCPNGRATTASQ